MDLLHQVSQKLLFVIIITFDLKYQLKSRTNPSTQVATWKINNVFDNIADANDANMALMLKKKANYLAIQDVLKRHRAVDVNLINRNEKSKCSCLGVLESVVIFWNFEGPCTASSKTFLLIAFEVNLKHGCFFFYFLNLTVIKSIKNGKVLFCDALIENKQYFVLNCGKDPVKIINLVF
jgi:hypothetical protein